MAHWYNEGNFPIALLARTVNPEFYFQFTVVEIKNQQRTFENQLLET